MRNKGFTLIELLIYVSIFAVAGGMMFGILALILKVNQRESSTGEITSQMNFISQTLSRLIRSSSNIEIDTGVATSTLKLRMKDATKDPTCIYLDSASGIIKLAEGPDSPFNLQNCSPTASNLTNDRIKVDKLEFTKSTQYPGHDSVNMNIQMSYNSPNPGAQASRELKSASMRFSTAEFSDNIIPSNDALYDIGTSTARWRNAALSGNLLVAGNVGIGTTTPSEKLTVVDGNLLQKNSFFTPPLIGGANLEGMYNRGIYVSGRYAYIVQDDIVGDDFKIYDISNPASPTLINGTNLGGAGQDIYVSGRYAYIVHGDIVGDDFKIYDISNPASPTLIGGADLESFGEGIFIAGRYAYIVQGNVVGNDFKIYDISNPTAPSLIGGSDLGNTGRDIYVSGRYAYITQDNVVGNDFKIYDISNPTAPSLIGGADLGTLDGNIFISGRYAYIVHGDASNDFKIYDISNPTAPSLIGGADLGTIWNGDVFIAGHYAYITHSNITGDEFKIFDISNPIFPVLIGGVDLGTASRGIYISGRYAYIVADSITGNEFKIFDISGIESVSANIHSLEAGNLQVRNDIIAQGQLQITGGINVGTGGIFSAGPLSVSISSTTQTNAISAYFQGRVGIATTTPQQALEVNGGIRLFTSDTKPNCDATDGPKNRGTLWHVQGANDQLQICAASSTTYAWRNL